MQNLTLWTALDTYSRTVTPTKKGRNQEARRLRIWQQHPLADRQLESLRGVDFAGYRDRRLEAGASRSTVRLELAIISHLYSVAARDWGLEGIKNPIKTMRIPAPVRGRERRLREGEEPRLLAAAEQITGPLKPLILLALETAMRRGELVTLRWRDVNLARRTVFLPDTKNGDARTVPLTTRAGAILEAMPRTAERVFPYCDAWVSRRFHQAANVAGLEDLRFHDLRHEATSRLFELGRFTMLEISLITGHKTLAMLKRYTHLTAAQLAAKLD